MDARELLAGLAAVEISTSCSVSLDTARRWKRRGRCPQGMQRLLELTLEGELGAVAAAFAGWRLDRLFELSPSREKIDAGDAPPGAPCSPASTGRDGA